MKKPNMLITKINHTEQSVEWEILRETYKQSNSIEVMDKYYKDYVGDFYVLAKPSIAENLKTSRIVDRLESNQYSIRDSMENWGEQESLQHIVSLLSSYETTKNNWTISLIRHKNHLYLFHTIRLNINSTEWFDKNGEPHTTDLADICVTYARSICTLNCVEQITNLNKISELMKNGKDFNFNYTKGFNRFSLRLSMKDVKHSKSLLRDNLNSISEQDSYNQIGFLSFIKGEKIDKITICKCWYQRLVDYFKDRIPQLNRE